MPRHADANCVIKRVCDTAPQASAAVKEPVVDPDNC